MNLYIEKIKQLVEYSEYLQAKQDYKDVVKGGKDYACCSFMDISVRSDRLDSKKKKLINELGSIYLEFLEENNG